MSDIYSLINLRMLLESGINHVFYPKPGRQLSTILKNISKECKEIRSVNEFQILDSNINPELADLINDERKC